jgi:ABC-type sugar transport system ATPase subunit
MRDKPLSLESVWRSFGGVEVLRDFTLDINLGEFVAVVGPSGCGKTTLLNLLSGVYRPDKGRVRTTGRVRMVYQQDGLFPWRTVAENIGMGLRHMKDGAARVPKRPAKERDFRKLFYDAERAYRDVATRADAIALYRKLAADFVDASVVKPDADLVRRRSEEGREAFLDAGALKAAGTFKPSKDEKLGAVWTSAEDSEPAKAVANYLEFEFLAVAEPASKGWVYAGGCCGEVFGFSLQASDLTGPKAASAAPGSETSGPVRHGLSSVKARHVDHMVP